MDEREAYIALNMMEKVGLVGVRGLVECLGSARAIFDASESALAAVSGVPRDTVSAVLRQRGTVDWQGELDRAAKAGARLVAQVEPEYPSPLLDIHDPPMALYIKGTLESRDRNGVAVVGTRRPTHYGVDCATQLSLQLAQAGITIVSGLAEGVDTAAHKAAIQAKGRTLAVIGSGFDCLYPASNRELATQITQHGAVMSEFPFGRQPDRTTFPIRNRIVSGLSMGILVIEADFKSGAMITANQALDQGRAVFAVPGRIDSPASRGTNDLIKTGAKLVAGVEDILQEFEMLLPAGIAQGAAGRAAKPAVKLNEEESRIFSLLEGGERDVDSLIRESGMKAGIVSSVLIGLEMKRVVRMLPGRLVEKIGA